MATSLFEEPPSMASYQEYPTNKPFINSALPSSGKPVKAYPENSSEAVLSALKGLQEKIRNLEVDRSKAEKNLKVLAAETSAYKDLLNQQPTSTQRSVSPPPHSSSQVPPDPARIHRRIDGTAQIESQLHNADARCELLERQLDNMRRMVQHAERERSDALERHIALERDRGRVTAENRAIKNKLDKMEFIHTRYEDLELRKNKSESRIKELEERLKEEEHQRKLLIDRAAQLQTDAETERILKDEEVKPRKKSGSTLKKKKKKIPKVANADKQARAVPTRGAPRTHYRLNLADVPFITGTSTSPSHAVSANMQKLLHDLKQHNPIYCNEQVVGGERSSTSDGPNKGSGAERGRRRSRDTSTIEDLNDLLSALQDEFGKLTFEHQVLVKQSSETYDAQTQRDLDMEVEALVSKMERKGEQISTVKRHISQLSRKHVPKIKIPRSKSSASANRPSPGTVQIGTRHPHSASSSPRSCPMEGRERRLAFLRQMRNVRSALHRDDLSWD